MSERLCLNQLLSAMRSSLMVELGQPPLEQAPLGVVVDECKRAAVGVARLLGAAKAPQQLTPGRVDVMEVRQREAVDDREPRLGTLHLGDSHGPLQPDARRACEAGELAVDA